MASGAVHPAEVLTRREGPTDVIEAWESFDRREDGWTEVELETSGAGDADPSDRDRERTPAAR